MKLSVIIPCYNEKLTVLLVVKKILELDLLIQKEVVMIDDFSSDGTRDLLKSVDENHEIVLCLHERNRGKEAAL